MLSFRIRRTLPLCGLNPSAGRRRHGLSMWSALGGRGRAATADELFRNASAGAGCETRRCGLANRTPPPSSFTGAVRLRAGALRFPQAANHAPWALDSGRGVVVNRFANAPDRSTAPHHTRPLHTPHSGQAATSGEAAGGPQQPPPPPRGGHGGHTIRGEWGRIPGLHDSDNQW